MKKTLTIILVLMITVFLFGCFKIEAHDKYKKEYSEIMDMISEKYGKCVNVDVGEFDRQVSIELMIKEDYLNDIDKIKKDPVYEIIEDVRVTINDYIGNNPNSRLANQLESKTGLLLLEIVKDYYGSSQGVVIFEVKTDYRDTTKKFNQYNMINIEGLDNSLPNDDGIDYNYFVEEMYNYVASTGKDIKYIVILDKNELSDEEQEKWREEVKSKFPLMTE